jgi:hypothetical protein
MSSVKIASYKNRLDNLFSSISNIQEIELKSHWSRYLCVLVAGFVEVSIQTIFCDYARKSSSPHVSNYVNSKLKRFINPNMQDIIELAGMFNSRWGEMLEQGSQGELKDAVDSVMANRNQIAHGENVGISYVRIKEYYNSILKLIDFVESNCS